MKTSTARALPLLSLSRFKVTAITLAPKSLIMFGRFCSATRCHALVASGESRTPTPLDPLFEVCSWPAPRKVYPLGSEMNSSDCPRHVSERQMANALRHCAVWTSSVRRESVFNPRQFCANMCSRLNFLAPEDLSVAVSSGAQVTARVCETRCVWVACWRECRWEGRRRNDVALSGQRRCRLTT